MSVRYLPQLFPTLSFENPELIDGARLVYLWFKGSGFPVSCTPVGVYQCTWSFMWVLGIGTLLVQWAPYLLSPLPSPSFYPVSSVSSGQS